MAGSIGDKLTDTFNAANPNSARVTSTRSASGATLVCDNLAGWPTSSTSAVCFATYKIDTNSKKVAGSQTDWIGLVSGNSIGTLTRVAGAADSGNAIGDVVEMMPTAYWAHLLYQALVAQHSQVDGSHTAITATSLTSTGQVQGSNLKLTTGNVLDTNGNEEIKTVATASAVNEVTFTNGATGNAPLIQASGDDTNIDLKVKAKGTGRVELNGAGAAASATILTSESSSSTSYTDLATAGPAVTVTIGNSGMALVSISAYMANNTASGDGTLMSFAISGANTQSAGTAPYIILYQTWTASAFGEFGRSWVVTGLTAGSTTFTAKYAAFSGGTGTWKDRNISVVPL